MLFSYNRIKYKSYYNLAYLKHVTGGLNCTYGLTAVTLHLHLQQSPPYYPSK